MVVQEERDSALVQQAVLAAVALLGKLVSAAVVVVVDFLAEALGKSIAYHPIMLVVAVVHITLEQIQLKLQEFKQEMDWLLLRNYKHFQMMQVYLKFLG